MAGEITAAKQRGRPFKPGESGNPLGRPGGAHNRATVAAGALLDGEADALTRKAIELALAGDTAALRPCLERILPPRKDRPLNFALPPESGPLDPAGAMRGIVVAMTGGQITPRNGRDPGDRDLPARGSDRSRRQSPRQRQH